MSGAPSTVAIVGGGVPAAMAALALARAFGRRGLDILWVETDAGAPAHSALTAPPDIATFHRLLGIDEADLLAHAAATINMGQQFVGWSDGEAPFLHAYGDAGSPFASLPFLQSWSRARRSGLGVALEDFCLAAAAAKQGRTGQPRDGAAGQRVEYGFHVNAQAYAGLLRRTAQAHNVRIVPGAGAEPHADGGRLSKLSLPGGDVIQADLFIDTDGRLIAALEPGGWVEADAPCDRIIRASAPPIEPLPLFSRVSAHQAGWLTFTPLADRIAIDFAYASDRLGDEEAAALLPQLAARPLSAAAPAQRIHAGHRLRPWVGNCVAIGPAAVAPPLLDAAEMLLLQLSIAQLVLLWPLDRGHMPEAGIYNEEMAGSHARVADFAAMHFRLNQRTGQPFWDEARAAPITDALASKIALFEARGMIAHLNHEAHVDDSWFLCLTGHGLIPNSSDPQADRVGDHALMVELRRQLAAIAADVRSMEVHDDARARMKIRTP